MSVFLSGKSLGQNLLKISIATVQIPDPTYLVLYHAYLYLYLTLDQEEEKSRSPEIVNKLICSHLPFRLQLLYLSSLVNWDFVLALRYSLVIIYR